MADTAITEGWLAGEKEAAFAPLFPAATTYVIPDLTELLIAVLRELDEHWQPKLRLAISIRPALSVTYSIPFIIVEIEPEPELLRTLTAHNLAPGATPTTPIVLSLAAAYSGYMSTMSIVVVCRSCI